MAKLLIIKPSNFPSCMLSHFSSVIPMKYSLKDSKSRTEYHLPSLIFLALCVRKVQPVGRWFEAYCQRRRNKQTLYHSLNSSSSEESDQNISEDEEDSHLLLTLDPKDWKVSTLVYPDIELSRYATKTDVSNLIV